MRPKGGLDKKKRKVKVILDGNAERKIIDDYNCGNSLGKLAKKYNVSKSYISNMLKRRKIKTNANYSDIVKWKNIKDLESMENGVSGIYGLYFIKNNDIKLYVGSSTNIKNRLKDHHRLLKSGTHDSKLVQQYFDDKEYSLNFAIIKECDEKSIMQNERFYQHKYNENCLLNSWRATNLNDLLPWLDKAILLKSYGDYIQNDNGCWESKNLNKRGYGVLRVVAFRDWGIGITKYFYNHRVAYWEKYGEYPELIRHKCGNKKCRNPDHLEPGNHKDNALDRRGDFPEIFEKKWVELGGDIAKLSKHFGWKGNCRLRGKLVSSVVYGWEKKLNLRDKYPEILASNKNRKKIIKNN